MVFRAFFRLSRFSEPAIVDVAAADKVGVAVVDVAAVFAGDSFVVVVDVELAAADGGGFVAVVVECFVVSVEV